MVHGPRVEIQLLTTLKCNLKCTYCSMAEGDVIGSQTSLGYDLDHLEAFIAAHLADKEKYVTFYGGEPTLNMKMMKDVITRFPSFRYQLQTNGTLLDDVPDWVLSKLSNILVSIDGGEEITDGYRGKGIHRKVLRHVAEVRPSVGGTVTARVTWGNPATTFEELDELTQHFDYLYWQFVSDAMYSTEGSQDARKEVLIRLIEKFFAHTETLYRVVPLMGIVRNMIAPTRIEESHGGHTQCRVSSHILNVMPDGNIYPCPDMTYDRSMWMGSVKENVLLDSPLQRTESMPCARCEAFSYCRTNCIKNLYLAYEKRQPGFRESVADPICDLIKFMGAEIKARDPHDWFSRLSVKARQELLGAEIYDYVEISP